MMVRLVWSLLMLLAVSGPFCCACINGVDSTRSNGLQWKDDNNDNCAGYESNNWCAEYGGCCEQYGMTANQACCYCANPPTDSPTNSPTTKSPTNPTNAPTPRPTNEGEYSKVSDKFCGRFARATDISYGSLEKAQSICSGSSQCYGVYDKGCNDIGEFGLCKWASLWTHSTQGSCIYEKNEDKVNSGDNTLDFTDKYTRDQDTLASDIYHAKGTYTAFFLAYLFAFLLVACCVIYIAMKFTFSDNREVIRGWDTDTIEGAKKEAAKDIESQKATMEMEESKLADLNPSEKFDSKSLLADLEGDHILKAIAKGLGIEIPQTPEEWKAFAAKGLQFLWDDLPDGFKKEYKELTGLDERPLGGTLTAPWFNPEQLRTIMVTQIGTGDIPLSGKEMKQMATDYIDEKQQQHIGAVGVVAGSMGVVKDASQDLEDVVRRKLTGVVGAEGITDKDVATWTTKVEANWKAVGEGLKTIHKILEVLSSFSKGCKGIQDLLKKCDSDGVDVGGIDFKVEGIDVDFKIDHDLIPKELLAIWTALQTMGLPFAKGFNWPDWLSYPLTQLTFPSIFDIELPDGAMLYLKVIPAFLITGFALVYQLWYCLCAKKTPDLDDEGKEVVIETWKELGQRKEGQGIMKRVKRYLSPPYDIKGSTETVMTFLFVDSYILIGTSLMAPAACVFEKDRLPYIHADSNDPPLTCWGAAGYTEDGVKDTADSHAWFALGFFCCFSVPMLCSLGLYCRLKNRAPNGTHMGCCGTCSAEADKPRAVFYTGIWLLVELFCLTLTTGLAIFVGTLIDNDTYFEYAYVTALDLKYIAMTLFLFMNLFQVAFILFNTPCNMQRVNVILLTSKVFDTWSCLTGFGAIQGNSDAVGIVWLIGASIILVWFALYGPFIMKRWVDYAGSNQFMSVLACVKSCGGLRADDAQGFDTRGHKGFIILDTQDPGDPRIFIGEKEGEEKEGCHCGIW